MRSDLATINFDANLARVAPTALSISEQELAVGISVTQGKITVRFPEVNGGSADLCQLIIAAVQEVDLEGVDSSVIGSSFFSNDYVRANRINDGVVETPKHIARFIVSTAFNRWHAQNFKTERSPEELHWLDPCSGAGVFPCEILNFYFDVLGAHRCSDLPYLSFAELSPTGLALTLCNLKVELQNRGLDFSEYLATGRLTFYCGDSIQLFPEGKSLFDRNSTFDIVVGNPPYVRSTRLTLQYKKHLRQYAPNVYAGGADLYTYFIASGIANLKPNGVLAYISPAAYSRAKSGQVLRRWLRGQASLDTYLDLDETKVFSDAELHSAIYVLAKHPTQKSTVNFLRVSNNLELTMLCNGTLTPAPTIFELDSDVWSFHSSDEEYQVFAKIFSRAQSLRKLGLTVYSGIRSGYSDAFIIDEKRYLSFSKNIREKWFKPTILPANITRWHGAREVNYMLVIPSGTKNIEAELLQYLLPFKDKLARRVEVTKSDEWFTLRPCSYYSAMNQRKIAFPDLSAKQRFSYVDQGVFIPDGAYFIDSNSPVLLGILNSSIAKMYFINRCSSVGNLSTKGRFRFKKTFVQDFPIPPQYLEDGPIQSEISAIVDKIVSFGETDALIYRLDELVTNLYNTAK